MKRTLFAVGVILLFAGALGYATHRLIVSKQLPQPKSVQIDQNQAVANALPSSQDKETITNVEPKCLADEEEASYQIIKKKTDGGEGVAVVEIKNKKTSEKLHSFEINVLQTQHYHPIELHHCYVYATRDFNYDWDAHKPLQNYSTEIWRYDYLGRGMSVVLLDKDALGGMKEYQHFFSNDFRIDPQEQYIALERSYLGTDDYALVIKDLDTKEDAFVLTLKMLSEKYPDIQLGSFGLGQWDEGGENFRGDIFDGARENAYYHIDMSTRQFEALLTPSDILAGVERASNVQKGYLAYADFPTFFGMDIVATQEQDQFRKEGKVKHLYIYNLRTKEKELLAQTSDPEQRFNIKWISNAELQYELPGGETKIYTIQP